MYAKQEAIQEALKSLRKHIGKTFTVSVDMFEIPPRPEMGDLAFPCFELAKGAKRNPVEIATELAAKIGPSKFIEKIISHGPYVNFYFQHTALLERVVKEVLVAGDRYGFSQSGDGKKVLVEYAQPNTHKEFHVGHIRNAVLGQSVLNILHANGYETIGSAYIGDIGAHVAKALWGYKKFIKDTVIPKEKRAETLGEIYTKATQYVEKHPKAKEEIDAVQRDLESRVEPWHKLWKETREWSLAEFKEIFEELNVSPDVWYYESDVEEKGKEMVKKLLTNGIAKKSEGATIIDLEAENLGAFLILKSDGSSLYATKDLALAFLKQADYEPDRQIFVVDARQSFYFKQLFAALKKIGFNHVLNHVAYEMVTLPEGAMSSRTGNVVRYRELHTAMMTFIKEETRKRHEDWSEKQITQTAEVIVRSAITFMMLRQDPTSILTFDSKEAMSVEGFTGPYILYTVARIESIKKKAGVKSKLQVKFLTSPQEYALARALAEYPEVVQRAGATFQVSLIAAWAFETAKLFAEFYHEVKVIDEANKPATQARLALIEAVLQALKNALSLLCIDTVKEM